MRSVTLLSCHVFAGTRSALLVFVLVLRRARRELYLVCLSSASPTVHCAALLECHSLSPAAPAIRPSHTTPIPRRSSRSQRPLFVPRYLQRQHVEFLFIDVCVTTSPVCRAPLSLHSHSAFLCFSSAGYVGYTSLSPGMSWPVRHGHIGGSSHILSASSAISFDNIPLLCSILTQPARGVAHTMIHENPHIIALAL